tara:strand:- start:517 stop:1065 length:549 start_codon:yes stop_codon:yes gene_type:complete
MTSTTTDSMKMTTQHLQTSYELTPDELAYVVKSTITFTRPVTLVHQYTCDLDSFTKMFTPRKGESKDEFQARILAVWVTLAFQEGGGATAPDLKKHEFEIEYEHHEAEYEANEDGPEWMEDEIHGSARDAWMHYESTTPEGIAKEEARKAAIAESKAKTDERRRLEQVKTLKAMLGELGEKV